MIRRTVIAALLVILLIAPAVARDFYWENPQFLGGSDSRFPLSATNGTPRSSSFRTSSGRMPTRETSGFRFACSRTDGGQSITASRDHFRTRARSLRSRPFRSIPETRFSYRPRRPSTPYRCSSRAISAPRSPRPN